MERGKAEKVTFHSSPFYFPRSLSYKWSCFAKYFFSKTYISTLPSLHPRKLLHGEAELCLDQMIRSNNKYLSVLLSLGDWQPTWSDLSFCTFSKRNFGRYMLLLRRDSTNGRIRTRCWFDAWNLFLLWEDIHTYIKTYAVDGDLASTAGLVECNNLCVVYLGAYVCVLPKGQPSVTRKGMT